ncbi:MAG: OPT family oligopeptide transporter [Phycisphaerales bacterium]
MAIKQLTDEQVQTWTREQKDRWWLAEVFKGDMPQLTLRAAVTGFLLGGILSATNLYVGAKTGWTLGVGITSVILAFAVFRMLSRLGLRDLTILENNCSQSIATAAGYMTSPLVAGLAAYMWIQNEPMNWWQMLSFNVVLSILGVLVAFPMKRRFINDEQAPFPEGRAAGVVLDTLYTSEAATGIFKAKALGFFALLAGVFTFVSHENYQKFIQLKLLGMKQFTDFSKYLLKIDEWYYDLVAAGKVKMPTLSGVDIRELALRPEADLAMFGAGALMGIKAACSLLLGAVLNFAVIVPIMIAYGELKPKSGTIAGGDAVFGRAYIMNNWALWWGITMMVTAAMVSLFAKPKIFVDAFRGFFGAKKDQGKDVLRDIELPLWVSWVGVPIVGGVGVWMAHDWFGVSWVFGATAIPLICLLALIAVSSTALTGTTPGGSLSKIPQFTYGALDPKHPPTNLMTAVMCSEVATNSSNLLMDIKPGYMLGAKPRQQAIGHIIGIFSGCLASTPLFYMLFTNAWDKEKTPKLQDHMVTEQFGFPGAVQWKGVSDLVTSVFGGGGSGTLLTTSIIWSMAIAGAVALVFEVARIFTKGKFPLIPLAIGLGVVVPPGSTLAMFCGALFFWLMHKWYAHKQGSFAKRLWVDTHEPVCAGIIAGAALVGIGDLIVKTFLL